MKISFTGDLFLGGDLQKYTKESLKIKIFNDADKRVVNLEQAVSNSRYEENKCTLYTNEKSIKFLQKNKVNAVNLAHNHIQDKGILGIVETVSHLNKNKINSFGAGENINEARKPVFLTDNVCIFGYCDFDKPYLKQVVVANDSQPGVNPLRYENIINNLQSLPHSVKAILYFHWGREHVFLPPYQDIKLAKKLLRHDKVLGIIGMHCHRIQGVLKYKEKRAYMSLGNFLFPNFYISPPTQITVPDEPVGHVSVTRQYHKVYALTYKKWTAINRCSFVVSYDTEKNKFYDEIAYQSDDEPKVLNASFLRSAYIRVLVFFLSALYKLPAVVYIPIEIISSVVSSFFWRLRIHTFWLKQLGSSQYFKKISGKITKKVFL